MYDVSIVYQTGDGHKDSIIRKGVESFDVAEGIAKKLKVFNPDMTFSVIWKDENGKEMFLYY